MTRDLFGNEVDLQALLDRPLTAGGKPKRKPTPKRGHFFKPGTGPEGETCGSCKFICRVQHAKVFLKCGLNKANWSHGAATDIRARDLACRHWEAQPDS